MNNDTIEEGKTIATISYLTIIGSLIAIFLNTEKKNEFASFHIRQGLGLCILYMAIGYCVGLFNAWSISIGFWIGFSLLFIYGVVGAITGKTTEIPLIGGLFQKLFIKMGL